MNSNAYVYRNGDELAEGLRTVRALRRESWKHVDDKAAEYNTNFIRMSWN